MPQAKFVLKEPNSESETLIYLFLNFGYKRLKYSTGEKILPKLWDDEKQRPKSTRGAGGHSELAARLSNLKFDAEEIYRKLINDKQTPTPDKIRYELDLLSEKIKRTGKPTLLSFISSFIAECQHLRKPSTLQVYNSSFDHLKAYAVFKRTPIDFDNIDIEFYNGFTSYLAIELKLSNNTIGKIIKTLKTFLNEATERGINTNLEFKKRKFKTTKEESDSIYLTTEELDKIYALDLSEDKPLERVRDLFIIGCYTGLRFSDFSQIQKQNIIDNKNIRIRTQKTGEVVVIPLHKSVKEILSRYNGEIPKPISNQKMNDYLKVITRKADLVSPYETSITKGGKRVKTTLERCELITTHTARRSFATNLYLADVPAISIMKITGHRTEKSFLQYIRVTQEQNANKLLNHPFFK